MTKQCVVIGGTFAPITNAHIEMGIRAKEKFPDADILYVPSNLEFISDWKHIPKGDIFFNDSTRFLFMRNVLQSHVFHALTAEVNKTTDGTTYDLVNYLRFSGHYDQVILGIGYDKLDEIERWDHYKQLLNNVHLLVFSRNNEHRNIKYDHTWIELDSNFQNISSTAVRKAYYDNDYKLLRQLVPEFVFEYLKDHKYAPFDAAEVKNNIVLWIRDFFNKNSNNGNAVVGISGGKDSSIVASLCVEALGRDRVLGVLMPNSYTEDNKADMDVARKLVDHLGIHSIETNISPAIHAVLDGIKYGLYDNVRQGVDTLSISNQTMINLPARIRMATLYAISQSYNGMVANTCNLSEDFIGYATRYGDGAGDFSPLADLVVREVKQVGYQLPLLEEFIEQIPKDGLCGKTDEENLGFSYQVLDTYIRTGICDDLKIRAKIDRLYKLNKFKLQPMPKFNLM